MSCLGSAGPGAILCSQTDCNYFSQTSHFLRVCKCIDWQGKLIPGCTPKNSSFAVEHAECRNRLTHEVKLVNEDTCLDMGGDWRWTKCFCCCTDSSLLRRALASAWQWLKGGLRKTSAATHAKRMAACQACDHLIDAPAAYALVGARAGRDKICRLCGCIATRKAWLPHETCPAAHPQIAGLNRWGEPVATPRPCGAPATLATSS